MNQKMMTYALMFSFLFQVYSLPNVIDISCCMVLMIADYSCNKYNQN